jgi:hypothetical protein
MLSTMGVGVSSNPKVGIAGAVATTGQAAPATTALVVRYTQVPAAPAMQAREDPATAGREATDVDADPIVLN